MKPTYDIRCWKKFSLGLGLFLAATFASAEDNWTVHEWGTLTSLQNESGEAIGGINTDDEPVPEFVHRLSNFYLLLPSEIPPAFDKGAPSCHPDVTMRLETPVIYFHPPASQTKAESVNVAVKFHGGWLTEYYPYAEAFAPDLRPQGYNLTNFVSFLHPFGPLHSDTESKLEWNALKIGGNWPLTNATAHVWTSPRAVRAESVRTTNGESEKFLFYRGVAHINAPFKISRDTNSGELLFRSQLEKLPTDKPLVIRSMWLVDIRPDGKIAFRSLPQVALDHHSKKILTHTPAEFSSGDFSSGNLEKLKAVLQAALVSDGLFADEAQALLNTWELSYFKSAGLRVFFLVPRAWTDFYLPLEISLPADIKRVMVGRIELITPHQRLSLQKIARYSASEITVQAGQFNTNFINHYNAIIQEWNQLVAGKKSLSSFVSVPSSYQTYLDLGRFRNALILDEAKHHATAGLTNFITMYRLHAYQPVVAFSAPATTH
jgi:hypothetical protein